MKYVTVINLHLKASFDLWCLIRDYMQCLPCSNIHATYRGRNVNWSIMQGGLEHDHSSTLLAVPHNRMFSIINGVIQDAANLRADMYDL